MAIRSFRSRVVFLFLCLLTLVQVVGFVAVHAVTTHNAREQARSDVTAAATTFAGFIELRTKRLAEGGDLLASDFAFKTALFSADQATIVSALENHAGRIKADLAILVRDREIVADMVPRAVDTRVALARRLVREIDEPHPAGFALAVDNRFYQVVIVPVLAPAPVAWLALGLAIDDRFAREFADLARTQLSVLTAPAGAGSRAIASTFPDDVRAALVRGLPASQSEAFSLTLGASDYVTMVRPLKLASDAGLVAVFQRSLDDVSKGINTLRTTVTLFLAAGLVASLVAGAFVGKAVSKPIETLVEGVRRIEQGNYGERIATGGSEELEQLTRAVNEMAAAIEASRAELERNAAQLEDTVRTRTLELELASRHKSEFLANMSHELRTPLTAIIGFTQVVMRRCHDVIPARQYENLEKILASSEHLLALINNVLDLSKIEAGHIEVQPEHIAVAPLVEDCVRIVEPLVAGERVQLVRRIEPGLPPIYSDEGKVRQILINLLNNAAKFTEAGSITVSARRHGEQGLEIEVSDTGVGIPPAALKLIFEKFRQADNSVRRQFGGTGLGLAISRQLAQVLGGDITVASQVGAGATFTLRLPLVYAPVLAAARTGSPA